MNDDNNPQQPSEKRRGLLVRPEHLDLLIYLATELTKHPGDGVATLVLAAQKMDAIFRDVSRPSQSTFLELVEYIITNTVDVTARADATANDIADATAILSGEAAGKA